MARSQSHRGSTAVAACLGVGALTAGLLVAVTAPARAAAPELTSTPYGNFAEALHKSLYFYDAEMSGPSRSEGVQGLDWRGDSEPADSRIELVTGTKDAKGIVLSGTNLSASFISANKSILDPDGDGLLDLSRGYHDAGDHVKFGLPQTFAASTLAWGVYEFEDAYRTTGAYDHIMKHLYWFNDYFLKSTFRNSAGEVIAFNYQVGNGDVDHSVWGPPELMTHARGAMFATAETPASDQAAGAAAALAAMSILTTEEDPDYAERCLETAQALYRFAVAHRGLGFSGGYYGSSYDDDELSWAAVWLYAATRTESYLEDITAHTEAGVYTGFLSKIVKDRGNTWQNIWVHSWDTVWGGVFAMLAPLSKGVLDDSFNAEYWYYFRWNAEYWSGGSVPHMGNSSGDSYLATSPAGFSVLNTWGSARYNTAAQLCALVYRKHSAQDPDGSAEQGEKLSQWALSQMNYIMGDNPLHRSMITGFTAREGDTYVEHPHHRAAHGSLTNDMFDPPQHRHVLWGALAGGPDAGDDHNDATNDFISNEVAIDYNAGFVGALAGFYHFFGEDQPAEVWAPEPEPAGKPYYVDAKIEQENNQRTQVTVRVHQELVTPPTLVDDLSVRYYFDISELVENGLGIENVSVEDYYNEAEDLGEEPATITGPTRAGSSGNLYYITIAWPAPFYGKREVQLGLIADQHPTTFKDYWDGANDYSHTGLSKTALSRTENIPVYRADNLVFGAEPTAG